MNPGPPGASGFGITAIDIAQPALVLLVLGALIVFGILVLRALGRIERAVTPIGIAEQSAAEPAPVPAAHNTTADTAAQAARDEPRPPLAPPATA